MLSLIGGNRSDSDPASGGDCQVSVNADVLNVRAAPGLDSPVVDKLQQGEEIDAQPEQREGFRKLDDKRWASTDYLDPLSGSDCG